MSLCVGVCASTEARGGPWVFCSVTPCLIPLRQGLSLKPEAGWWPASFSNPPNSTTDTKVTSAFVCHA